MEQDKRLQLKQKAQKLLHLSEVGEKPNDPESFDHIIQELQIYQVELELQNEELVNSQANLQKQLAHTKRLFNTLPSAAVVVDERGLLTEINDSALALFGFSNRSLAMQHSLFRLVDTDSGSWLYETLLDNEQTNIITRELHIKSRHGTWMPAEGRILLMPVNSDMHGHAIIIFRDLSAELKIKRQQQQFQSIINNSRNLIFVVDKDSRLQLANEAFQSISQPSTDDSVIGLSLLDLLLVDEVLEMQTFINEVIISQQSILLPSQKLTIRGYSRYFSCQAFPIYLDEQDSVGVAVVASDITELTLANNKIKDLAFYDSLTGAANRVLLNDRIDQLIEANNRERNNFVLFFIDLDHFKEVNDLYGHTAGDRLLIDMAKRLNRYCRPQDTVARLGGDEFVVLMSNIGKTEAYQRGHELLQAITEPLNDIDSQLTISASIGAVQFPDDAKDRTALLQYADAAMYRAKELGKNQVAFFDQSLVIQIKKRATISSALRLAIEHNELAIVLQPLIDIETHQLCGAEALLRWHSKTLENVPPDQFIPIAEGNGTIREIGQWVLDQSFEFLQCHSASLPQPFRLAINVSGYEFWQDDYAVQFSERLKRFQIDPSQIELELTETIAMQRPEQAMLIMKALKAHGVRIALDDFGTGYSSLGYLKQLPIDTVKIDKTFISDIGFSKDSETICTAIVSLGNALGLSSTAEGIETKSQLQFMKSLGCKIAQGFYFAKPMSISAFVEQYAMK